MLLRNFNYSIVMILVFLYSCELSLAHPRIDPLVQTNVGLIRGLTAPDGDYSMFLGIPYGVVGDDNPFGPSTPYPPFEDTFIADDDSATCAQYNFFSSGTVEGSLDCLQLNIYVPNSASSQNRLPVIAWIHGGAFNTGSKEMRLYGPKYLVRHDVIVVAINYRLGAYGFMCLGTPEVPGNQGFKDQYLALQWIHDNIEAFGGDNDKITLMGESAGAASVDFHLYYAPEKLFRSVIIISGTVFSQDFTRYPNPEQALELAENLGFVTDIRTIEEALRFLATVDSQTLVAATPAVDYFFPCVENVFDGIENYVTDFPINVDVPHATDMPILIGIVESEMHAETLSVYTDNLLQPPISSHVFRNVLNFSFSFDDDFGAHIENITRYFYVGDAENIEGGVRLSVLDFFSDFVFNYPTQRSIAKMIENRAENIYHYVFTYVSASRRMNDPQASAVHGDQIMYLFDSSMFTEELTPEDQLARDRLTTLWTNFVKFGDPTPDTSDLLPVKWTPISSGTPYHYLDIGSELRMRQSPFHERMAFWDLIYTTCASYEHGYREI